MYQQHVPRSVLHIRNDVALIVLRLFFLFFFCFRFLYGGFCDIDETTVIRLLSISKKYDIPALVEKCKQFLENNINVENVGMILDQAITFEETEMEQKCLNVVSRETSRFFQSKGFLSLSRNGLKSLLDLNEMEVLGEEEVYLACKKWAEAASAKKDQEQLTPDKLRSFLADCLPLIRFPSMTIEIFVCIVCTEDILSEDEKLQIIQDIVMKGSSSGFNAKRRSKSITFDVQRMTEILRGDGWSHTGKQDGISFSVSDLVNCVAVAIYLPSKEGEVSGPVEVLEDQTVVQSMDITLKYQSGEAFQFVTLKNEFPLKPDVLYSIRQRLVGTSTFYGKKDMGKQIIHDTEIRFKNLCAGISENNTTTGTGQIHGIRFKKCNM